MSIVMQLICDFPACGMIKEDLVWWESTKKQPKPWLMTKDGRHWCWQHTKEEINIYLMVEEHGGVIPTPAEGSGTTQ
jgi:hypothetical protein